MTNKDKILRYLECGLKVKATDAEGSEFIIYASKKDDWGSNSFIVYSADSGLADTYPLDFFDGYTITPIPTKPNYSAGDLVTILPIAREANRYDDWHEAAKDMIESGVYEIKLEGNGRCAVYTKDKSNYWFFPSWSLAPAFPDDAQTYEKAEKLRELEARMEQIKKDIEASAALLPEIQKEIEALKK